jgi:hypothetical protein
MGVRLKYSANGTTPTRCEDLRLNNSLLYHPRLHNMLLNTAAGGSNHIWLPGGYVLPTVTNKLPRCSGLSLLRFLTTSAWWFRVILDPPGVVYDWVLWCTMIAISHWAIVVIFHWTSVYYYKTRSGEWMFYRIQEMEWGERIYVSPDMYTFLNGYTDIVLFVV